MYLTVPIVMCYLSKQNCKNQTVKGKCWRKCWCQHFRSPLVLACRSFGISLFFPDMTPTTMSTRKLTATNTSTTTSKWPRQPWAWGHHSLLHFLPLSMLTTGKSFLLTYLRLRVIMGKMNEDCKNEGSAFKFNTKNLTYSHIHWNFFNKKCSPALN